MRAQPCYVLPPRLISLFEALQGRHWNALLVAFLWGIFKREDFSDGMIPCGRANMVYSYAVLAENADVMPDGRFYVFKGGIEVLHCPSVPCIIPALAILVRVSIPPDERGLAHVVQMQGFRPNGQEFTPVLINRMEPANGPAPPDRSVSHIFVVHLNGLLIQEHGLHHFRISGDSEQLGDFTFYADPMPGS